MGDLSDFQRGQIVGVGLAGASLRKTATLLGVSKAALSKVMMTYAHRGRTSAAKGNSGQRPKLSEGDRCTLKRIVSIYHRSTAAKVTAETLFGPRGAIYGISLWTLYSPRSEFSACRLFRGVVLEC